MGASGVSGSLAPRSMAGTGAGVPRGPQVGLPSLSSAPTHNVPGPHPQCTWVLNYLPITPSHSQPATKTLYLELALSLGMVLKLSVL
jgi:hypothetical protein